MKYEAGSRWLLTAIVLATLVIGSSTPLGAVEIVPDRSNVRVTVFNPTPAPQFVRVEVRAVLESGEVATGSASTALPPGASASVEVPLPGDVQDVIFVGMVLDDGVPF